MALHPPASEAGSAMNSRGSTAGLLRQATQGGSRHVTGDPAIFGAPSPLGDVHMLAPPVGISRMAAAWPTPRLVPRGSSRRPQWQR